MSDPLLTRGVGWRAGWCECAAHVLSRFLVHLHSVKGLNVAGGGLRAVLLVSALAAAQCGATYTQVPAWHAKFVYDARLILYRSSHNSRNRSRQGGRSSPPEVASWGRSQSPLAPARSPQCRQRTLESHLPRSFSSCLFQAHLLPLARQFPLQRLHTSPPRCPRLHPRRVCRAYACTRCFGALTFVNGSSHTCAHGQRLPLRRVLCAIRPGPGAHECSQHQACLAFNSPPSYKLIFHQCMGHRKACAVAGMMPVCDHPVYYDGKCVLLQKYAHHWHFSHPHHDRSHGLSPSRLSGVFYYTGRHHTGSLYNNGHSHRWMNGGDKNGKTACVGTSAL